MSEFILGVSIDDVVVISCSTRCSRFPVNVSDSISALRVAVAGDSDLVDGSVVSMRMVVIYLGN